MMMGLPNYSTEGIVKANLHLARSDATLKVDNPLKN